VEKAARPITAAATTTHGFGQLLESPEREGRANRQQRSQPNRRSIGCPMTTTDPADGNRWPRPGSAPSMKGEQARGACHAS